MIPGFQRIQHIFRDDALRSTGAIDDVDATFHFTDERGVPYEMKAHIATMLMEVHGYVEEAVYDTGFVVPVNGGISFTEIRVHGSEKITIQRMCDWRDATVTLLDHTEGYISDFKIQWKCGAKLFTSKGPERADEFEKLHNRAHASEPK